VPTNPSWTPEPPTSPHLGDGVLLIDEPVTSLDAFTASRVLAAARQCLPRAVLILAMHELPADTSVLGPDWAAMPLD